MTALHSYIRRPERYGEGRFDPFINNAELLLTKKGGPLRTVDYKITVSEKVDKKAVPWTITYKLPQSLTLAAADVEAIDLILKVYPNQY